MVAKGSARPGGDATLVWATWDLGRGMRTVGRTPCELWGPPNVASYEREDS